MSNRRVVRQLLDNPEIPHDGNWTTGNIGEAFPGVFTTLGFSYVEEPMEQAFRNMFWRLGVFDNAQLVIPDEAEDMFFTLFDGWAAANIDKMRDIANVTPGSTASGVEQQLFGYVRPETVDANTVKRYPAIAAKAPRYVARLAKRHDAMFAELRRWRLESLARLDNGIDRATRVGLLEESRVRFREIMTIHMAVAMISSALVERVAATLAKLGLPELEAAALSGVGADENQVAEDIWMLAHDRITLREFTDRHGYHGRNEGQLSGTSWREDPSPILTRLDHYRAIAPEDPRAPTLRSARQLASREAAMAQITSAAHALQRRLVAKTVTLAARFLALREQGKAGYLMPFDVARACMRSLGADLVEAGSLDDVEDVFHLSYQALCGDSATELSEVPTRRQQFIDRQSRRLPQAWTGQPQMVPVQEHTTDDTDYEGTTVTGVAASGGVATGRARVVRDPSTTDLDDGDILVCETTDPSWVALFMVAGAVVTDHGGMLSHGPIVAREIGIPCVCGTEIGSRRIRDGQLIRVDGNAGTVEILAADTAPV